MFKGRWFSLVDVKVLSLDAPIAYTGLVVADGFSIKRVSRWCNPTQAEIQYPAITQGEPNDE